MSKNDFLKAFYADENWQKPPTKKKPPKVSALREDLAPAPRRKISRRTKFSLVVWFLLVPAVIYFGSQLGVRHYLAVSLALLFLAMLPFVLLFEDRKPQARELVVIAVLIGLAVAGRGVFFMLPQFKPVAAIVIVSGIALGAETGFLVGCGAALVSNLFFSQGPWTPWQMVAFGLIGFVAGLFFRWGLLKPTRRSLCTFGFFSIFLIYGGIMNPASLIMYMPMLSKSALIAAFISGAPMDLIHALSTVFFLAVLAKPFLAKLQRIKVKYGLI